MMYIYNMYIYIYIHKPKHIYIYIFCSSMYIYIYSLEKKTCFTVSQPGKTPFFFLQHSDVYLKNPAAIQPYSHIDTSEGHKSAALSLLDLDHFQDSDFMAFTDDDP